MEGGVRPRVLCGTQTHPMKRCTFPFLLVFQLLAGHVLANGPGFPASDPALEHELMRQVDKYVHYPLLAERDMDGEVLISFVITTEGRVVVVEANGTSEILLEYVLRRIRKIDIGENPSGAWRTTHMHFRVRPEA